MNIHLLQDYAAIAEAKLLMAVEHQLLNAQNNKPTTGIVQDALLGSFLLTSRNQFLTREEMMQLMMTIKYPVQDTLQQLQLPQPAIQKPVQLWTGKQAFSMLIPRLSMGANMGRFHMKTSEEESVVIQQGELLCGRMCKRMIGSSSGGLVHVCCKLLGNRAALNFMSDCQRMINLWLETVGFSIGLADCLVTAKTAAAINQTVSDCVGHVDMVNQVGKELHIPFLKREEHAAAMLAKMLDVTGGMIKKDLNPENNALTAMVTAGSKGNPINISQVSCVCVNACLFSPVCISFVFLCRLWVAWDSSLSKVIAYTISAIHRREPCLAFPNWLTRRAVEGSCLART